MAIETPQSTRDEIETRYCTRHPDRETLVSCGRCGKPFCTQCLVHTPAGQRCYECAGVRRDFAQRATVTRLLQGFGIALIGAVIASFIGGFYSYFIAGIAGSIFGQTVSPSVNRHTKPWIWAPVAVALLAGAVIGSSVPVLLRSVSQGAPLEIVPIVLVVVAMSGQVWIFALIAAVAAYLRMR